MGMLHQNNNYFDADSNHYKENPELQLPIQSL